MVDRVQLIKRESEALGGSADDECPYDCPISPQEDAIEAAGLYLQDGSNRDETVLLDRSGNAARLSAPLRLSSYTVADLPAGSAGDNVFCTDEAGGAIPVFHDGADWRRLTDRAIVWAPYLVSGCALWLRGDLGVMLNGSDVLTWADWSGEGNDADQSTPAEQPAFVESDAYFNGRPSVHFDGATGTPQYLEWSSFPSPGSACDVFIVNRVTSDPAVSSSQGAWNFGTDASFEDHYPHNSGAVMAGFGSTARKSVGNPTLPLTTPHVLEMISTSSEWTMNIAGAQHFTTGTNAFGWRGSGWSLGKGLSSSWKARVAEMVLFDHKLIDSDRAILLAYFTARYAL